MKTYRGGRDYNGWLFMLEPQTAGEFENETGRHLGHAHVPGYRLRTLEYAYQSLIYHRTCAEQAEKNGNHDFAERIRAQVTSPPAEWREERWLTEWLKAGLIREVSP